MFRQWKDASRKAREGKWNGGFAPYGYELVNGELQIAEDEAEIIRLIYDKFIHTNMGISAIAAWLNQHGYKRKNDRIYTGCICFFVYKRRLDNPVYCGKLAYGRGKRESSGTRNEYRIVKQEIICCTMVFMKGLFRKQTGSWLIKNGKNRCEI